jgi:hypothetical protein
MRGSRAISMLTFPIAPKGRRAYAVTASFDIRKAQPGCASDVANACGRRSTAGRSHRDFDAELRIDYFKPYGDRG